MKITFFFSTKCTFRLSETQFCYLIGNSEKSKRHLSVYRCFDNVNELRSAVESTKTNIKWFAEHQASSQKRGR